MLLFEIVLLSTLGLLAQEQIPLHSSANGFGSSTNPTWNVQAVAGQNVIGGSTSADHSVYFGLLSYRAVVPTSVQEPRFTSNLIAFDIYPNPFDQHTTIAFSLLKSEQVKLEVYDLLGRQVKVLTDQRLVSGEYTIRFDRSDLPPGLYYCKMKVDDLITTKPMLLVTR